MKIILINLILVFGLTNCAIGPTHGFLFTSNKFAGEFNPENDVKPLKSGSDCQKNFLSIIVFGNASAGEIAKKNNILRIATIDHSTLNVLTFIYSQYCTTVYGE